MDHEFILKNEYVGAEIAADGGLTCLLHISSAMTDEKEMDTLLDYAKDIVHYEGETVLRAEFKLSDLIENEIMGKCYLSDDGRSVIDASEKPLVDAIRAELAAMIDSIDSLEYAQPDTRIEVNGEKFDYLTLQYKPLNGWCVYGWGTYKPSSVLAGQPMKVFIDSYGEDKDAALAAYPSATPSNEFLEPQVSLSHLPDENDPVPGGMYLDDLGGDSDRHYD